LLGSTPGTGGTTGVRYLIDRMAVAFPELWQVRSALHDGEPAAAAVDRPRRRALSSSLASRTA
jgi:hypothetical protein